MSEHATVMVVDDDEAMRMMLVSLLRVHGFQPEAYANAGDLLAAYDPNRPCCVLTDVRMPGMTGVELLGTLMGRRPQPVVILLTGHSDLPLAVKAMRDGAFDFIEKPPEPQHLVTRVEKGLAVNRERLGAYRRSNELRQRYLGLTRRERDVLVPVVQGETNKAIAELLGLSPRTVEIHRANVMQKMEADSLAVLVRMVIEIEAEFGELGRLAP